METTRDPAREDSEHAADRRIEEAKASLVARIDELARRLREARHKLDVPAHIAAHPFIAVGAAFALGALLGSRRRRVRTRADSERGVGGAIVAALGALAMSAAKDFALHHAKGAAGRWLDAHADEAEVSRRREMESFLEH
jgi:hypothetical protein